jgi:hypothetical protein
MAEEWRYGYGGLCEIGVKGGCDEGDGEDFKRGYGGG